MTERWVTPPELFDPLMDEFAFDLDAAADTETTRLPRFLIDALTLKEWPGNHIWLNPPYGKQLIPFVRKAFEQAALGKTVVGLIPFRCRGAWWHDCVIGKADEVRCIRKRPRFLRPDGSRPNLTGTCDSCIVVWRGLSTTGTRLVAL